MTQRPQFRKTKIIATIGPACDDIETLTRMIRSGMNVARLNLSHGDYAQHHARVERRIRLRLERIDLVEEVDVLGITVIDGPRRVAVAPLALFRIGESGDISNDLAPFSADFGEPRVHRNVDLGPHDGRGVEHRFVLGFEQGAHHGNAARAADQRRCDAGRKFVDEFPGFV